MKRLSEALLKVAESLLLRAYGWTTEIEHGQQFWLPPGNYEWTKKVGVRHRRGHAINSLKSAIGNRRRLEDMAKQAQELRYEDPLDEDYR